MTRPLDQAKSAQRRAAAAFKLIQERATRAHEALLDNRPDTALSWADQIITDALQARNAMTELTTLLSEDEL